MRPLFSKAYCIACCIALAACGTPGTPVPTVTSGVREVPVNKQVFETCVTEDEVPKVPGTWLSESQTKEQRRAAILADGKELEEYLLKADGLLRACAKPRPKEAAK